MSANKAKPIKHVQRKGDAIAITYYDGKEASLYELPRVELMSLSAKLGLGTAAPNGDRYTNETMLERIRGKVYSGPDEGYSLPVSPLKVLEYEGAANPTPANVTTGAARTPSAAVTIEAALQVLANAMGSVNPDEIRSIVDEHLDATFADRINRAISEHISRPFQVIVNTIPAGPPVEGLQHEKLAHVCELLAHGMNVALIGPAGTGKSFLARQAAQALGREYTDMSCSADGGRHDLLGYTIGDVYRTTPFRDAYENGKLFLLDEADRADASVTVTLNGASASSYCTFADGVQVRKHPNHLLMLAMNTFGDGADAKYVSAQPVDAAMLNRYVKVWVDYDRRIESAAAGKYLAGNELAGWLDKFEKVRANVTKYRVERVTGTRDVANGALLISLGLSLEETLKQTCLFGLNDELFRKCTEGVR